MFEMARPKGTKTTTTNQATEVPPVQVAEVPVGVENADLYRKAVDALSGTSEDDPLSAADVVQRINAGLPKPTAGYLIYRAILNFTRIPGTRIRSRKGRSGGYFLSDPTPPDNADAPTIADQKKEKTLEKHLWPVATDWLRISKQIDRVSSDVAHLKGGGVWSNPDIVGLSILEDLGFFDVEITTLEVKQSLDQWRYYFFEAVSHKRFSERVYFVYRDENYEKSDQRVELLRYAEKGDVILDKPRIAAG